MHESHLHHIQYKTRLPRAPSSLALNTSRGGRGIHNLSGQLLPASHHSLWKEQSHLTSHLQSHLQLKTISPWPDVSYTIEELAPLLFVGSLYVLEGFSEVTPLPSLLQAKQGDLE